MLLVCIGLLINVLGSSKLQHADDSSTNNQDENNDQQASYLNSSAVVLGSIIALIGSLLHSLMFVLSDMTLRGGVLNSTTIDDNDITVPTTTNTVDGDNDNDYKQETTNLVKSKSLKSSSTMEISGTIWSCCLETIETTSMFLWVFIGLLFYGFHTNNDDTIDVADNAKPSACAIIGGFLFLVIIDTSHAASFFTLLQDIGAMSSALTKGVQTVIVIILSAMFFCGIEETQCLNTHKTCSAFFVLIGVLCYSAGSNSMAKRNRTEQRQQQCNCCSDISNNDSGSIKKNDNIELNSLIKTNNC